MTAVEIRQKNATAAIVSLAVTAALLLIMWSIAFGSMEGMGEGDNVGMEVNLGESDYGSGNVQPMDPVGSEKPQEDEPEAAQSPNQEDVAATQPEEAAQPPAENTKATESIVTSKEESPVEIKDKEDKKEIKPVEKKIVEKPKEKVEPKPVEKTPEKPKEDVKPKEEKKQPVADVNAVYKPGSKSKTDGTASSKEGKPGSEGDDKSGEGDKGVPGGTPGAAVYKGTPGGGNGDGPVLDLNGWDWDAIPKPKITESETGRIVFNIEVDENGDLIGYKKESGSLSAASEKACIDALKKLTFSKEAGAKVPPISKGKITFVVRAE
jgi:periplasmic protein TonB